MARYCSDCTNLKPGDKKCDGQYKCSKVGKYVLANMNACDKFSLAYSRRLYDREKLYDYAKALQNKPSGAEPGTLALIGITLIILVILFNIFM